VGRAHPLAARASAETSCLRSIYTIEQIVSYNTIFTDRINPIFIMRHFHMSYDTIHICRNV
jgi:hypothetical protein